MATTDQKLIDKWRAPMQLWYKIVESLQLPSDVFKTTLEDENDGEHSHSQEIPSQSSSLSVQNMINQFHSNVNRYRKSNLGVKASPQVISDPYDGDGGGGDGTDDGSTITSGQTTLFSYYIVVHIVVGVVVGLLLA